MSAASASICARPSARKATSHRPTRSFEKRVGRKARVRLLEPEAPASTRPSEHRAEVVRLRKSQPRHQRSIERPRALQVVHREEHVMHAAGLNGRRSGWASASRGRFVCHAQRTTRPGGDRLPCAAGGRVMAKRKSPSPRPVGRRCRSTGLLDAPDGNGLIPWRLGRPEPCRSRIIT